MKCNNICLSLILLAFLSLCTSYSATAQKYDRIFLYTLNKVNLKFKMPKGFKERDSITLYNCYDDRPPIGTIIYTIVSNDSNVVIGFFNIGSLEKRIAKPSIEALRMKNYYADSTNYTVQTYDRQFSQKNFNADEAGEFSRSCPRIFLDKYTNNRIVYIANNKYGTANMVYFYTDKAKPYIKDLLLQHAGMLKFIQK